jgi:hypothetical protein
MGSMWFVSVLLGVVVVTPKPFYLVSLFDGYITFIIFSKCFQRLCGVASRRMRGKLVHKNKINFAKWIRLLVAIYFWKSSDAF